MEVILNFNRVRLRQTLLKLPEFFFYIFVPNDLDLDLLISIILIHHHSLVYGVTSPVSTTFQFWANERHAPTDNTRTNIAKNDTFSLAQCIGRCIFEWAEESRIVLFLAWRKAIHFGKNIREKRLLPFGWQWPLIFSFDLKFALLVTRVLQLCLHQIWSYNGFRFRVNRPSRYWTDRVPTDRDRQTIRRMQILSNAFYGLLGREGRIIT